MRNFLTVSMVLVLTGALFSQDLSQQLLKVGEWYEQQPKFTMKVDVELFDEEGRSMQTSSGLVLKSGDIYVSELNNRSVYKDKGLIITTDKDHKYLNARNTAGSEASAVHSSMNNELLGKKFDSIINETDLVEYTYSNSGSEEVYTVNIKDYPMQMILGFSGNKLSWVKYLSDEGITISYISYTYYNFVSPTNGRKLLRKFYLSEDNGQFKLSENFQGYNFINNIRS